MPRRRLRDLLERYWEGLRRSDDPYYRLALRERIEAALDAEFEQLALRVLGLQGLQQGVHADSA